MIGCAQHFENAPVLNKLWWYLLKHACFIAITKSKIFQTLCVHFQWKKTNSSRHIGILSALRMRCLHDKRQLLAKLRIAGSEKSLKRATLLFSAKCSVLCSTMHAIQSQMVGRGKLWKSNTAICFLFHQVSIHIIHRQN